MKKDFTQIVQNDYYCGITVYVKNPLSDDENKIKLIAKKLGGICNGSGYSFLTKQRDMGFFFPTKEKAQLFAKNAFEQKLIKSKLRVFDANLVWEYSDGKEISYSKIK